MYTIVQNPGIMSMDACIASSDVLSQLSEAERADLTQGFEWVSVLADEILFNKKDPADGLYIIASGRLEVFNPNAPVDQQVIGRLSPGELVGEMALLSGEPRGASVRAVRDSLLLRLSTEKFQELASKNPKILFSLTRVLVKRLETKAPKKVRAPSRPVVALVPYTQNAPVDQLADKLAAELRTLAPCTVIRAADVENLVGGPLSSGRQNETHYKVTRWLQDIESSDHSILFVVPSEDTPWAARAIREADTVLLVANAKDAPLKSPLITKLRDKRAAGGGDRYELVLLQADDIKMPSGTRKWLDSFSVDAHHHIRLARRSDLRRLSRFLSGRAVALALAGGAGRGFAHIGVLRAFEEANIPIDTACGTSMGAFVAGLIACGYDSERIEKEARTCMRGLVDVGLPVVSMLSGRRWMKQLVECTDDLPIEDLWLPFFAMASSLSARPVMMKTGSAALAMRASSSVPGMFPPVKYEGEFLIDGGFLNNLPAELMQREARGKTVAVNVMQPTDKKLVSELFDYTTTWGMLSKLNPLRANWALPVFEVAMQGMFLNTFFFTDPIRNAVDLWIDPPVNQYGFIDPTAFNKIVRTGYEEARRRLVDWKDSDPEVAQL